MAGRWHLLATSNTFDQPWIFKLSGDPAVPSSWLHWTGARMLVIPGQPWDTGPGLSSVSFEHANSVFLCDARMLRTPRHSAPARHPPPPATTTRPTPAATS